MNYQTNILKVDIESVMTKSNEKSHKIELEINTNLLSQSSKAYIWDRKDLILTKKGKKTHYSLYELLCKKIIFKKINSCWIKLDPFSQNSS